MAGEEWVGGQSTEQAFSSIENTTEGQAWQAEQVTNAANLARVQELRGQSADARTKGALSFATEESKRLSAEASALAKKVPGTAEYKAVRAKEKRKAREEKEKGEALLKHLNEVEPEIKEKKKKRKRGGPKPKPKEKGEFEFESIFDAPRHSPYTLTRTMNLSVQNGEATDNILKLKYGTRESLLLSIPTEWLARCLKVTQAEPPLDWFTGQDSKKPYYKIHARRISPAGDWTFYNGASTDYYNPDTAIEDPCPKGTIDNHFSLMHPLYTPTDINQRMPRPGDLIFVSIHELRSTGKYTGFATGRTLANLKEEIAKAALGKKSKLKDDFPARSGGKVDDKGCAAGDVSNKEILAMARVKYRRSFKKSVSKLRMNTKRFLKALDEELARVGSEIKITSTYRSDRSQSAVMYRNWNNLVCEQRQQLKLKHKIQIIILKNCIRFGVVRMLD